MAEMEMENSKESSSQDDGGSSFRTNSKLSSHSETNPHYSFGCNLNPNTTGALKIKDTLVEIKAHSSTFTIDNFEKQQKLEYLPVVEDAQHFDIGPLLFHMDKVESRKRPEMNRLSEGSKNDESNAGTNLLGHLQSFSAVLDDPDSHSAFSNIRKRPRPANMHDSHDPPNSEANCGDEPTQLASSLKRLGKEELERIIMGHMAGCVTIYKPYVDMERELDSCKEKVERLRQKNELLSKEVAELRIVVKSFVTQNAIRFERPTKRYRSVGVQVKPSTTADSVKFEENGSQGNSFQKEHEGNSPVGPRKETTIPHKICRDNERQNGLPRIATYKTADAKREDEDLMVTFIKPSNPAPVCEPSAEDLISSSYTVSEHPVKPILPKPVVTVEKTVENSIPAVRIAWEIPEKQRYAKVASYCVFLLNETRNGFRDSWNPITGDIPRMSFTFRVGRADKLRSSYRFKVRAIDVHGRHSPFSEVAVVNFPRLI